ncbi:hypothetical protein ACN20G_35365 (plasmid) [Streptomyces sp. BI20]|uniref:hypothetical protein n=1 Tax=Streptomyces sp. BI20 TaxID=3403460 RepID=UPI003C72DC6B
MNFITPPRPVDVTALFPRLAPLARTTTRLHPRPGAPGVHDSSVGGPLLWPADEPWPQCAQMHDSEAVDRLLSPDDIRVLRRDLAAATERLRVNPGAPEVTPEERENWERIKPGRPWFDGPIDLIPVAQLFARDAPIPCPPGMDLLQVLWCPFDHEEEAHPRTVLVWRSSTTIGDILAIPPQPPVVQSEYYLPEPCLFSPEQVTEFPHPSELDEDLADELNDTSRWESVDPALYSGYAYDPQELYLNNLCTAPGWKIGGWTRWSSGDPVDRPCPECGVEEVPLLTIASSEWDRGSKTWIAEERSMATMSPSLGNRGGNFTLLDITGGNNLQLHVCPHNPAHPHITLLQ